MIRYLLDTSAVLLALKEPAQLKPEVRAAVVAGPNVLSVISFWEVMLKSMKGKLKVGDPRVWWLDALGTTGYYAIAPAPRTYRSGARVAGCSPGPIRPGAACAGHN